MENTKFIAFTWFAHINIAKVTASISRRSRDPRIIYESVRSWLTGKMKRVFSKLNPARASPIIRINHFNQQKAVTKGRNLTSDPLFRKRHLSYKCALKSFAKDDIDSTNATEWRIINWYSHDTKAYGILLDVICMTNLRISFFVKCLIYLDKDSSLWSLTAKDEISLENGNQRR